MPQDTPPPPRPEDAHKLLRGKAKNFNPARPDLERSLLAACRWLTDLAQVRQACLADEPGVVKSRFSYADYRGAIKGEYSAATREWSDFGPVWHTGQAAAALVQASGLLKRPELLAAAEAGAAFILRNQVTDPADEDCGMIAAFEGEPGWLNTSAILESLSGLWELHLLTGRPEYLAACRNALDWVTRKMVVPGEGLVRDLYLPAERRIVERALNPDLAGRPLADDAMFLKIGKACGVRGFIDIFFHILDRLLADEGPAGNWLKYDPCVPEQGLIHPRHAYWWGMPFLDAHAETGEARYLAQAIRCGDWYLRAQRRDGGIFRLTYTDFTTPSFGHATSAMACAIKLWTRLWRLTGDPKWLPPAKKGLEFCMKMQVQSCQDANLQGVIIEKINQPDGTDRSLIHIRDLGTIFYVQAVCDLLRSDLPDHW